MMVTDKFSFWSHNMPQILWRCMLLIKYRWLQILEHCCQTTSGVGTVFHLSPRVMIPSLVNSSLFVILMMFDSNNHCLIIPSHESSCIILYLPVQNQLVFSQPYLISSISHNDLLNTEIHYTSMSTRKRMFRSESTFTGLNYLYKSKH